VPFPERGPATLVRWSERQARERAQAQAAAPADERAARAPTAQPEAIASP
jgi:hypothetical protein